MLEKTKHNVNDVKKISTLIENGNDDQHIERFDSIYLFLRRANICDEQK